MSDDFDKKDKTAEGLVKSEAEASSGSDDEYEKICFLCRRPESVAGQMIDLPNHIHICTECMQKSFDTMNQGNLNYQDLMNHMPNISMIDLNSLQNQIPNSQKIKKRSKKGTQESSGYPQHTGPAQDQGDSGRLCHRTGAR